MSPSDAAEDLPIKVDQYLAAGAKQVWVVYPLARCVHSFSADGSGTILHETQTLTAGDLLPRFQ